MTADMFERAVRAFTHRRPFKSFIIEFTNGAQILVSHPEAVDRRGRLFAYRGPDGRYAVFAGDGVCRLVETPDAAAS